MSTAQVGSLAPDVTVTAFRTDVCPDRSWVDGRPAVLIFHGRENRDVACAVAQTVRNIYTDATSVITLSVVDLSMFPRVMRRLVRSDLDRAFDHAAVNLSGDRDPESHIIIIPDHSGEMTRAWGFRDTDRIVSCVVLDADWRVHARTTGTDNNRDVMRALGQLPACARIGDHDSEP